MRRLLVVLAACGATAPKPAPSPPHEPDAPGLRLGHFSSKDHAVGAVIEQRAHGARIKVDGTDHVIDLDRGTRMNERTDYIMSANHVVLQMFDDGHAVFFLAERPDGVELQRDGDVDPVAGVAKVEVASPCCTEPSPTKNAPPEVKLKLGHYRNVSRGIGVVVDVTHHEAKVRFDGADKTLHLDPINHSADSVDYGPTINTTTLRISNDGRIEVWVEGNRIEVKRDADADPL